MSDYRDLDVEWSLIEGEGLVRVVPTDCLRTAVVFTIKVAEIADKLSHDPDIRINPNQVIITLISHDEQSVTDRDYEFAHQIDHLLRVDQTSV